MPIGSGIAESGNKVVMQRRMKQADMRWAQSSLNPMLALRNLLCNRRWTSSWHDIYQQRLANERQLRFQRLQPMEVPLPLTLDSVKVDWDKPADHQISNPLPKSKKHIHPWRDNKWPVRYC